MLLKEIITTVQSVTSYPEVIRNNVDNLEINEIIFRNPFIDLSNRKTMFTNLKDEFKSLY